MVWSLALVIPKRNKQMICLLEYNAMNGLSEEHNASIFRV
jgi:hypothetical protein